MRVGFCKSGDKRIVIVSPTKEKGEKSTANLGQRYIVILIGVTDRNTWPLARNLEVHSRKDEHGFTAMTPCQ